MLVFKIKKAWLKDFETFLRSVGGVIENRAYPSFVYASQQTENILVSNLKKAIRKNASWKRSSAVNEEARWECFNLGPSICDNIQDGYVVVDYENIITTNEENIMAENNFRYPKYRRTSKKVTKHGKRSKKF